MSLTQVGFPKELSNEIDYSIPANVNSYQVKVVPSNLSQVQSSTQTLTASSTLQLNGTSSNVIFDIPAGQGKGVFIDPRFSTLNFRVNYEVVNTPSAAVITTAQLRSSAYAHWDRCYLQSQEGVILDDVNLAGLVMDTLIQLEVDVAQRDALATMYGFQYEDATANSKNVNQGHSISSMVATLAAAQSNYYSYSMPLLSSLLGKGAKKFFQIGATNKLQLVMQSAAILPITFVTGTATTAATFRITIDNISLNLQYIDIGAEGVKMLNKTGVQYYDGITYRVSSATLPSTAGAVSLLTGIRGSSVRGLLTRCCEAATLSTAGCINYIYDSKMPQATSAAYNVNGVLVPPNPVDLVHAPATVFSMAQECNASFNTYEFKSGLVPTQYFVYVPSGTALASDADKLISLSSSSSTASAQAQFLFGQNLEKISKAGILDGANLNSGNTFLNLVLSNASTNTLTFFFIAKMDIIYILDTNTGSMSVRL